MTFKIKESLWELFPFLEEGGGATMRMCSVPSSTMSGKDPIFSFKKNEL